MIVGSMVALVTPMHRDGSLDWQNLSSLVEWHMEQGTSALVVVGTTGEAATLNRDEYRELIDRIVAQVAGCLPVIAGTGANATAEAIERTKTAADCGVDACLLVTPYYNRPTQEGLYQHHQAIANAVAIPQILYNVPARTAVDMLPQTIQRLTAIDNIVGVKEASGDLQRAREVLAMVPEDFAVYSGDDSTAAEFMLCGGQGVVSVTANVAPAIMAQLCTAALAGDEQAVRISDQCISDLHRVLAVQSNPIPVKWALQEMGRIENGIRLPLTSLSVEHHELVRAALRAADLL